MLIVESVVLREIILPLKEPFKISSGVTEERRILLLELSDTEGGVAWSECVAGEYPNYSSETIDTARIMIRDHVLPRLLGRPVESPVEVRALLEENFRGNHMAKAAVEMGVWVLEARQRGMPLSKLLGGTRERVEVGISIGIQNTPTELVKKVEVCLEEGYRKIKIKIMPGEDVEYVAAVREALGPEVPLMVDANSAYTLDDLEALQALDRFNLLMIEQPLASDDLVQHAVLQRGLNTPLCLDESITGPDRVLDMIELGSGQVVNIKPGRAGGFTSSIAIHDRCEEARIPVWCGGMLECGIGRGYNLAMATLPNFTIPGDISPSSRYWEKDIVTPEWQMDPDGTIRVPLEEDGIGVEVDTDRVEDLTVWSEKLTAR